MASIETNTNPFKSNKKCQKTMFTQFNLNWGQLCHHIHKPIAMGIFFFKYK